MLRPRHAILATCVVLLAACGGDAAVEPSPTEAPATSAPTTSAPTTPPEVEPTPSPTATEAPVAAGGDLVDAFAASILASQSAAGADAADMDVTYDEEEARCIAQQVVDGVGEDALREYGLVTPEGTIAEGMDDVEFSEEDAEVVADGILGCSDVLETMQSTLAADFGAGDEMGACLQDAIDADVVRSILTSSLMGDDGQEAMGPLMMAALGCMGEGMTDLPTDLLEELPTDG